VGKLAEPPGPLGRAALTKRPGGPDHFQTTRIYVSLGQQDGVATMELAGELDIASEDVGGTGTVG
jgi:hypothetical protein